MRTEDLKWMDRALALAARGAGETNPNPMVGCVIVKEGRVVGEGYHRRAGGPHAEIVALDSAGARARGATLYVNLEPCAHQGQTPPCAPRLIKTGVKRVVAAIRDPDPRVSGRGFAWLRRSGVEVVRGIREDEARLLNERFLAAARLRRPFILLKSALTLDGRIATAARQSRWITNAAQRRQGRMLRRLHDAVAVGVGTVLADDPLLLPRPAVGRPFHRVVFDSRLRIPLDSRLVRSAWRAPLWVFCRRAPAGARLRLESAGVIVREGPARDGRVDLGWAIRELWRAGIRSLMVEGGSELLGRFLAERRLDQVALFRAPILLGGRGSLPAFGGPDPRRVTDGLRLTPISPVLRRVSEAPRPHEPATVNRLFELWYPVGSSR